jgi:Peptidase C39 family
VSALSFGLIVLAALPAQDREAAELVRLVAARFRQIEACTRALAVDVDVVVGEIDGRALAPPGRTSVRWQARAGRALVLVSGLDLDGVAGRRTAAAVERLYLPGGATETLDRASGSWSRDRRSYADAAHLASDLGPGEFVASFCGSARSSILEGRAARLAGVSGERPSRVVEIEADDRAGTQRIAFTCAEAWGFLPRCCRMSVRREGAWIELRRVEVRSARLTRLGWFPEEATLTALRPGSAGASDPATFERVRASYRFGVPEFAGVAVPVSLAANAAGSRPADPDPIFSAASVLFREPIAGRAEDLDALLGSLEAFRSGPGEGVRAPRTGIRTAFAVAAALVAFGAALGRRRLAAAAGGAGAVALLLWAVLEAAARPPSDAADRIARLPGIDASLPPASLTLCGVDCLYGALALSGERADYSKLVKLVRPGAQGTTLEALRIAAECLGREPRTVDPRAWDEPPDGLIAHVAPRHFVLVAKLRGGEVAVVDPARGIRRAPWSEVRGLLSRAACSAPREGGS